MRSLLLFFIFAFAGLLINAQNTPLIDAAFALNDNIVYFIKGDKVVTFDLNKNKVLNTALLSSGAFPGVSFSKIDAAVNYNGSKIYFFSAGYYIRFDIASFSSDAGYPKQISNSSWPGLSFSQIDAALSWPDKAYFFKGNQYARYSKASDHADAGYPKQTSSSAWPGLSFTQLDAAFTIPSGKSYFFRGNEYVRYDNKTDKADAGYPKSITIWPGLEEALKGKRTNSISNTDTDKDGFKVEEHTINLDVAIASPNSVLCRQFTRPAPDGGFYIAYPNKSNVYLQKFNRNIKKEGTPIVINNYWMSDFLPMKDGSIVFLLGRSVNNTYLGTYPNSLYFLKMNSDRTFGSPKLIFGENKHSAGESWFDGRSTGKISLNGFEFGIYFEVQKNWAEQDEEDDIHNGDMFVATDMEGNLKKDREHFWTASTFSKIGLL